MSQGHNVINTFHEDNWTVSFSNFPVVFKRDRQHKVDLRIFEYFVKNVVIPDSSLQTTNIEHIKGTQYSPISRANMDLPAFSIEFKADETLRNYFYFFSYIKRMRYGTADIPKERDNNIKTVSVSALDNQMRIISKITFTNVLPISCGSLNLQMGSSEELSFPVTFNYEEFRIILYDETGKEIYYDYD